MFEVWYNVTGKTFDILFRLIHLFVSSKGLYKYPSLSFVNVMSSLILCQRESLSVFLCTLTLIRIFITQFPLTLKILPGQKTKTLSMV